MTKNRTDDAKAASVDKQRSQTPQCGKDLGPEL